MPRSIPTGSRIRERRLALGRKQTVVAGTVGISPSYLNLIEHNRRAIGGSLLSRLATALETDRAALAEDGDEALIEELRAAAGAQQNNEAEFDDAADLARRFPHWAGLIAAQARALAAQARTIEALSDRLSHDPTLADAMHELLSTVSVVRSTASILAQTPEIDANWLGRFHANLDADSRRLADGSRRRPVRPAGGARGGPHAAFRDGFAVSGRRGPPVRCVGTGRGRRRPGPCRRSDGGGCARPGHRNSDGRRRGRISTATRARRGSRRPG